MWALALAGVLFAALVFIYVAKTKMPNTSELENPKFEEATIVYSSDGVELDRYFRKNREWVQFEELNPYLIDALIATEDHRYFGHSGIDGPGVMRAIAFFGTRGGASTITQQLALQFFTPLRSSNVFKRIWQKVKEWVIAVEFERRYTKEEIIAMYFNKYDFIYGANGVGAAARVYFGKDQRQLSINESAMLVGMLKNAYYFNPHRFPDRASNRRKTVLSQMRKRGYITAEEYAEQRSQELDMSKFRRKENYNGIAPYFMAELKKYVRNTLADNGITKPGGEAYDLDMDGLRIYTTIDSRYQRHAESAMKKHMTTVQNNFFKEWGSRDPWTYTEEGQSTTARTAILNNAVESSERYQSLRNRYLSAISSEISKNIDDVRLWNTDIIRMLRAESRPQYLDELNERNSISRAQQKKYLEIIDSKYWPRLKKAWYDLEQAVRADFSRKRQMKVYSHNGMVTKTMSPMDSIKYMLNHMQIGSVAMDPRTGHVKSWIGGIDFDHWKYDHVTSNRQAGSTFKPFIYTAALMNGISPCWKVEDIQYTIPANDPNFKLSKSWSPKNARGTFSNEEVTLKDALKSSLNSASVWLITQLGSVDEVISLTESMGIGAGKVPRYPSIVLGTPEVSVLEMTTAYSTFANRGITVKPVFIEHIEDKNGITIFESEVSEHRSIPEDYSYAMVEMLKHAGSSIAWQIKTDYGGKTGTTNDHVDGWFMGITPELVVGTWVGGEYPWIRFTNFNLGQGGVMARPFYVEYMKRIESDRDINFNTEARFTYPGDLDITLDCSQYEQKSPSSEEFDEEFDDPF